MQLVQCSQQDQIKQWNFTEGSIIILLIYYSLWLTLLLTVEERFFYHLCPNTYATKLILELIKLSYMLVITMVNKTGFNILIIETNALFDNWWEVAGCILVYLFLKNFAERPWLELCKPTKMMQMACMDMLNIF